MSRRVTTRLDNSCALDELPMPNGPSPFMRELRSDMGICSISYLTRHYPELRFTRVSGKQKPRGCDITEKAFRGWVCASWRTEALS